MAPRTRTRNTKVLKENIDVIRKTKVKSDGKVTKPPRKALADKTNSLSDDNASIDIPIKTSKVSLKKKAANTVTDNGARPRRDRRLPNRYVDNKVLSNLSSNKDDSSRIQTSKISLLDPSPVKTLSKAEKAKVEEHNNVTRLRRNACQQAPTELPSRKPETPKKQNKNDLTSPFKTPSQGFDSSLVTNRPKRICRLPSKFEDHSISPNKFVPVQPCHASTPLLQKNTKLKINDENKTKPSPQKRVTRKNKNNIKEESKIPNGIDRYFSKRSNISNDTSSRLKNKISPDSNNNKGKKILPKRVVSTKSPKKQQSPNKSPIKVGFAKRLLENNLSFRVFEDRKTENKDNVYEFTYDPNEEPKPQKKKRKKVVQKRPTKPKTVVFKFTYDKNVEKALKSLKSKVKPSQSQNAQNKPTQTETQVLKEQTPNEQQQNLPTVSKNAKIQIIEDIIVKPAVENKSLNYTPAHPVNESAKSIHMSNYASIHVEDIAADFANDTNDLNYSPVNSPCPKTPRNDSENAVNHGYVAVNPKDPLNLQGNVSFFDEEPVASSSMNMSVRNPLASPWRVEFNNLPIKWQANTYVKPDMTPAVECSFINSEEVSKKKHVYTNIVTEEPLPLIEDPPSLKQSSIISFMKEVAERSLKKKRGRSISPTKTNSLFEDIASDTSKEFGYKTPKKPRKEPPATSVVSNTSNDKSSEKSMEKDSSDHIEIHENLNEISNETSDTKENSNQSEKSPTKKSKKKDKDVTLFGFDDSENIDQENVSPVKNMRHTKARGLRAKSRVLQEINTLSGPTRAVLPVAKLASSEVVEKLYDEMKSAEEAPLPPLPEKQNCDVNAANDQESSDDDGQSVHLFEDIELVHHMKVI